VFTSFKRDRSPAIWQGVGGCDAGESAEEPQFLRPRRAKTTAGDQAVHVNCLFFVCFDILHDDDDRGFKFDNTPRDRPWPGQFPRPSSHQRSWPV